MYCDRDSTPETARQHGQSHRSSLEPLLPGICELDVHGAVIFATPALHRLLGYPDQSLCGTFIWDLAPNEQAARRLQDHVTYLVESQPEPAPIFTLFRRRDRTQVQVRIQWDYRRAQDEELAGFILVITDIENRERKDTLLEQRSQGLAAFLELSESFTSSATPSAILHATVASVTTMIGLDTAAVYLLDGKRMRLESTVPPLPPDFPEAMRYFDLVDHPHMARAMRTRRPVYVSDCSQAELTPAERSVAEARNLSTLLFVPIVSEEERLGAFIVGSVGKPAPLTDEAVNLTLTLGNMAALTVRSMRLYNESQQYALQLEQALVEQIRSEEERKHLLNQLAQAQKMESIGRLAGGIAHDFNNFLAVILGYAELTVDQLDDGDPRRQDVQAILDAAQRAADVTQQLLAFARKQTIRPRSFDANERIAGMLKMIRRLVGEDIDLNWSPARELQPVRMDPSQLDQVLVNLCANARDAIDSTGSINIETASVHLPLDDGVDGVDCPPGHYVMIAVTDDGAGMDEQTRVSVFEPFFTTKQEGKGTGLGLATVYGIARQNGACIGVESSPGRGTTFRVYLPVFAGEAEDPAAEEAGAGRPAGGGETILLAEDDRRLRWLVTRILEALDYRVLVADDAQRAVEIAANHDGPIHLLLTDVVMPQMNGRELAARIAKRHQDIDVLYMSGYTSDEIAERGVLEAGVHFIQKPFGRRELAARVREVLDGIDR